MKMKKHMEKEIDNMVHALWSFRKGRGLRQTDIAKKLGVTYNYISLIERRHRVPSVNFLNQYAGALGMKIYLKIGA